MYPPMRLSFIRSRTEESAQYLGQGVVALAGLFLVVVVFGYASNPTNRRPAEKHGPSAEAQVVAELAQA